MKSLEGKRQFRTHLATYVAVNAMLWVTWLVVALNGGTWFPWPIFASLGWGVAVVRQGMAAYGGAGGMSEADIQREMGRLGGE